MVPGVRSRAAAAVALIAGLSSATPIVSDAATAPCARGPALPADGARSNLDNNMLRWGVFCDPGTKRPRYRMRNVGSPATDGRALECSYRGGDAYSGVHCYRPLRPRAGVKRLALALRFRFSPTTCNNTASNSRIQALEFTVARWTGTKRAEVAVQYAVVAEGAPQWRVWDGRDWVSIAPTDTTCLAGDRWHRLELAGRIVGGRVRYDRLSVDGRSYASTASFKEVRDTSPTRLAVAVQADGNAKSTPYGFWVDRVTLAVG